MTLRTAIIIGAGPAGLTAALELLERSDIRPVILQRDNAVGGISRTVVYKGNRMDIGGHRFFSKSERVMDWWLRILPLEPSVKRATINFQSQEQVIQSQEAGTSTDSDQVMLLRSRRSRIYFKRQFFDYPIALSKDTLVKLGLTRTAKILLSYLRAIAFPIRKELSLEHFFINRFGRELYQTFFRSYTEKVWGTSCSQISAEWGRQRIKGLSIRKVAGHYLQKFTQRFSSNKSAANIETSLIEKFLYPKFGPGQMWEEVARRIVAKGGTIVYDQEVQRVQMNGNRVASVTAVNCKNQEESQYAGDFFFSTMPVKDLLRGVEPRPPSNVQEVSEGLVYRDFITVGLLLSQLKVKADHRQASKLISDNWIYIQEPDVRIGRLQIFNNWSPALVADPSKVWIGLEYFCFATEDIWMLSDEQMIALGIEELEKIGIIDKSELLDATVVREPKTYPAYFGSFDRFDEVRSWLDGISNLFPVGRNGMHRYNNQDHSMLTAMTAVDNILAGRTDKSNLWEVNTEQDYHEKR